MRLTTTPTLISSADTPVSDAGLATVGPVEAGADPGTVVVANASSGRRVPQDARSATDAARTARADSDLAPDRRVSTRRL